MTTTLNEVRFVFELVRYVNGEAVPYVPYSSGCSSCCGSQGNEQKRSCCG